MKRFAVLALVLLPSFARADAPEPKRAPTPKAQGPTAGASKAVTNDILDAIATEMNRDMSNLEIPNAPKPYSISYKITEVDVNDVSASLGSATSKRNRHFVNLEARVRVGSPAFDNGNFVVPGAPEFDGTGTATLPLEATPRIASHAAWLATDVAYKKALLQLRAKSEARRAGGKKVTDAPGWTDVKPVVSEEAVQVAPMESLDELETRAKTISNVFRDQPAIRDSRVAVTSYIERRWYITTEGTNVTDTRRASGVVIAATGQADDGQELHQYFLRYGHTAKDLPNDEELKQASRKLGETITALQKAPVMDEYTGPVLFEGEGAVGLIRSTLATHLGGTPVPEGLRPEDAKQFGGAFTKKVGKRVVATNLTMIDDPTKQEINGKALIGGYRIDDEGVASQRVEVIKDGVLKTLLTSRTPSEKNQISNGHARRAAEGGAFHGSATNLFVSGRGAVSRRDLENQLVAASRAEGNKYGLVIRQFDDAAVTSAPEFSRREIVQMLNTIDKQLPPPTTVAYRIYPGGKEELVRGVQLDAVPPRSWKDVTGISTETTTYNYLAPTESQIELRLTGGTDDGFVPSGGIESGIVTPDLMFKELDVFGSTAGERPAPAVPKPTIK